MLLETRLEAIQDLDSLFYGGFGDIDFLEAPGQCPILLEHAAVFLVSGGADTTQIAGREHRFDKV